MDMMPDITSIIALLISLITFALNIEGRMSDRHKLQYEAFMLWHPDDDDDYCEMYVQVTNRGKRPISITEVYFEEDGKERENPIRTPIYGGIPLSMDSFELTENQTRSFSSDIIARSELVKKTRKLTIGIIDSRKKQHLIQLKNEAYDLSNEDSTRWFNPATFTDKNDQDHHKA